MSAKTIAQRTACVSLLSLTLSGCFHPPYNNLLDENLEFGYMTLMTLQTMWPDYLRVDELFKKKDETLKEPA